MDKFYTGLTINKTWYDASNPVAPFTPVSLRSGSNDEVILPTVSNGVNTTRIIGVTTSFARIGEPVGILITGQILLISVVNTAITKGSTLFVASATTIASSAAPFTNVPGICPLVHPSTGAAYTM